MVKVIYDVYFEDLTPVIEIIDIDDITTKDNMISVLKANGLENLRDDIYFQVRGGMNMQLIENKLKKAGYMFKMQHKTKNPKACHFTDDLLANYIHFIPGTLIEETKVVNGIYEFYEYKSKIYLYVKLNGEIITNELGEQYQYTWYSPVTKAWEDGIDRRAISEFLTRHPEYTGKIKYPVDRTYHTIEKL